MPTLKGAAAPAAAARGNLRLPFGAGVPLFPVLIPTLPTWGDRVQAWASAA